MFDVYIKGVNKPLQVTSEQRAKLESGIRDASKLPNHQFDINGTTIEKGQIKIILQSEGQNATLEANKNSEINKLRSEIDQITDVIFLKGTDPRERTNLAHIKLVVQAAHNRSITPEEHAKLRFYEQEYLTRSPEEVVWFNKVKLNEMFPLEGQKGNNMQASFASLAARLLAGFVTDYQFWSKHTTPQLYELKKQKVQKYLNLGGKKEDLKRV